jgi:hypothetical protein
MTRRWRIIGEARGEPAMPLGRKRRGFELPTHTATNPGESNLAKTNFGFQKRQKELEKKRKKEEKLKKRQERAATPPAEEGAPPAPETTEPA